MVLRLEDDTVGAFSEDVEELESGLAEFLLFFNSLLLLSSLALSPRDLRFFSLGQLTDVNLGHVGSPASVDSRGDSSRLKSVEFFLEIALVHGIWGHWVCLLEVAEKSE